MIYTFALDKAYNLETLTSEIIAASLPLSGEGYDEIVEMTLNGETIEISAGNGISKNPTDLMIIMTQELTAGELTQLQTVLTNHTP